MLTRKWLLVMMSLAAVCGAVAFAQVGTTEKKPTMTPKEITMIGKVVDLQCFMSENYPSSDHTACTRNCIRAGVPTALETATGLYILSQGEKGAASLLAPFAFEHVEVKGKLYEKHGVKYIDVTSAMRHSATAKTGH